MNMLQLFSVGDVLYGYCGGFFGRDDYDRKICVMVRPKYAVFEYTGDGLGEAGKATILDLRDGLTEGFVNEWKNPANEEY